MRRLLLAVAIITIAAAPGFACINDVELVSHEREFRSQYGQPPKLPDPVPSTSTDNTRPLLIGGTGVLLLVGAVAVTLTGTRTRG